MKGSEAYVKRSDGYQHIVVMLFGIFKHFDSLRKLEIGMKVEAHKMDSTTITLFDNNERESDGILNRARRKEV